MNLRNKYFVMIVWSIIVTTLILLPRNLGTFVEYIIIFLQTIFIIGIYEMVKKDK